MKLDIARIVALKLNSEVNMDNKEYKEFDDFVTKIDNAEKSYEDNLWQRFGEQNKNDHTTPNHVMRARFKEFKKSELVKFASKHKKEKSK
jgi:hypothetical protein